ncbi:hypothetical protein [Thermosulfurimonas sp.]|uniref:hypothetical protein n=1 Tax=Thermosulfurimonas sp. TaxID=2080236 RepID=UPI0025DD1D62|nr:hypothetical protein [Thermosulfurimonas sp.]
MQVENQNLETLIERILETKAASLISKAVEDYIRRNEERAREFSLLERIVRVEEELKALREIQLSLLREMNARFEAMDKRFEAMEKANQQRFEAMEKRFEALDKRLSFLQWFMGVGFGFLAFLITLINFLR